MVSLFTSQNYLCNVSTSISRTSATNCARLYDLDFPGTFSDDIDLDDEAALDRVDDDVVEDTSTGIGRSFRKTLSTRDVWDTFMLVSLLRDCFKQDIPLLLPHAGSQKDRFTKAIQARNIQIQLYGQPEITHYCQKCTRFYKDENGVYTKKVSAVVTDGLTLGHPACVVHNCQVPLTNNRHRFCLTHEGRNYVCSIKDCEHPISPGHLTCNEPDHLAIGTTYKLRGQAFFQLKDRLARAQIAYPNNSSTLSIPVTELGDEAEDEEFTIPTGPTGGPKRLKAQFSRKRTHNEQLIVAACGIITARETFYGAEAISSVCVSFFLGSRIFRH
jgi:hypothetical protein